MNVALLVAAALAAVLGAGHSYHGERLLLMPLFSRGDLPVSRPLCRQAWGGEVFTQQVLRGVWHFLSLTLWTVAAWLVILAFGTLEGGALIAVRIIAAYSGVFALLVLVLSHGRHYAWVGATGIAAAAWLATV